MAQVTRLAQMNSLLAVVFLTAVFQTGYATPGGQHWFTSTRLVEEPNDTLSGGKPSYSESGNNYLLGTEVNKTRLFDLSISLYNNPKGDDNGNTQDSDGGSVEQDKIEKIIQFMADAIYDATEGAHKLGQIRIFRNKKTWDVANIIWDAVGHPCSPLNGLGDSGRHIKMYDIFKTKEGKIVTHFLPDDLMGAGFTLAHEFGHYAYGLRDEYAIVDGDIPVVPSIMNSERSARNKDKQTVRDARWLQFSIKHQGHPPGPFQNTLMTNQHRMYGESCWETLARTYTFTETLKAFLIGKPLRHTWPELAEVAPTGTNTPNVIHLPEKARSNLDIIWMTDIMISEIVIDSSGSMDNDNKMSNAKAAAKLLVDLAQTGSFIGVIQFTGYPTEVVPITEVTDSDSKESIRKAIDKISAGGDTSIGAAAQAALDALTASSAPKGNSVVFLLSDGQSQDDSLAPIPAYQAAKVPIFSFGYGDDADTSTLGTMASMTKGEMYISPESLAAITQVFQDAKAAASGTSNVVSGSSTAPLGASRNVPVTVDSTLETIYFTVTYKGRSSDLSVVFIDPNAPTKPHSPRVEESGGESLAFLSIIKPTPGEWQIKATSPLSKDVSFDFYLSGIQKQGVSGYTLTGGTSDRVREIKYPDPFILRSSLFKDLPIINAVVEALIKAPDGSVTSIQMIDDGTAPDDIAGDGEYTVALNYDQSGVYKVEVRARGLAGAAMQDAHTLEPSSGLNGEFVPFDPPTPLEEEFERFVRFQIETTGVVSDDHGNTIYNATELSAQNDIMIPGRIETGGDVDVFKIVSVPDGLAKLVIRVSNQAFGMIPVVKIINELMVEIAEENLESSQSKAGLLSLIIPVFGNETYFAEVSHKDHMNGTGYYQISAGEVLAQFDSPPAPSTPRPTVKPTKSIKGTKSEKPIEAKSEKKPSGKSKKKPSSKSKKKPSSKSKKQSSGKSK